MFKFSTSPPGLRSKHQSGKRSQQPSSGMIPHLANSLDSLGPEQPLGVYSACLCQCALHIFIYTITWKITIFFSRWMVSPTYAVYYIRSVVCRGFTSLFFPNPLLPNAYNWPTIADKSPHRAPNGLPYLKPSMVPPKNY